MHTTKTRRDVIYRTYNDLTSDAGQTPSAEDIDAIDQIFDGMIQTLASKNVVYIDDFGELGPTGGAIETRLFLPLSRWLANAAAPDFGAQFSLDAQNAAELELRQVTASQPTYAVLSGEFM